MMAPLLMKLRIKVVGRSIVPVHFDCSTQLDWNEYLFPRFETRSKKENAKKKTSSQDSLSQVFYCNENT